MAADAYQGHVSYGSFKVAATNAADVAPADAPGYDPTAYASQPGAAARALGYPRADGKPAGGAAGPR
jgi:hypothetical protein